MQWEDNSSEMPLAGSTMDTGTSNQKGQSRRVGPSTVELVSRGAAITKNVAELESDCALDSYRTLNHVSTICDPKFSNALPSRAPPSDDYGYFGSVSGSGSLRQQDELTSAIDSMHIDQDVDSKSDSLIDETHIDDSIHVNGTGNRGDLFGKTANDIYNQDEDGDTKLHMAIIHELPEIVEEFIDLAPAPSWLDIPNTMLQTALHLAVITKLLGVIRHLIGAGASFVCQDIKGNTPCHVACSMKNEKAVRALLEPIRPEERRLKQGEIVNMKNNLEIRNFSGETCLHSAVGSLEIMRILLQHGANINAQDGRSGRTVLHYAAESGDIECVEFLLGWEGLNINCRTFGDFTPIQLAFGRSRHDVFRLLYEHGAIWEPMD